MNLLDNIDSSFLQNTLSNNLVTNLNSILDQNGFLSQKRDSVFSHEKAKIIFLLENGKLNIKVGTMIGSDVLGRALSFEKNTRQENEYESIINDNNVRVRSGPSLLESVIGYCTKNQKIHIISKSVRPENIENQFDYWFEVEFENGVHGWVYGAFIDSKSKETVPINDKAQMVSESER